jgi:glucan biosynthesis protein C
MPEPDTRYHALDNLRAIMMWLGIVLHVAMLHISVPLAEAPFHDERTSRVADAAFYLIHAFRMPVFFVMAGFLAAMLLERRGPREFLRHRTRRLALPLALFWPLLWLGVGLAGLLFMNRMRLGGWGLDLAAIPPDGPQHAPILVHLWFLWMLYWFCVATAALALLPGRPFASAGAWLARMGRAWWGFLPLSVPLLVAATGYDLGIVYARGELLMPWNEWLHSGMFYVFGLTLWAHRGVLLPHYRQHWRHYALAGGACVLAALLLHRLQAPVPAFTAAYVSIAWLWGFAWIGLALTVLDRRHAALAYLADSAYWVYLLHLPICIFISAVLYQQPLPALAKMAINIALTSIACLASYQLFVRHTWISVLLNGKRHPRRGGPPVTPAAAAG